MAVKFDRDRILALLGANLPNGVVASTVGCDASLITQLMAQEEFAAKVVELRTVSLLEANARDTKINNIEDNLIEILAEQVATRQIYKPRDILTAFAAVNKAHRRGNPSKDVVDNRNLTVELSLPISVTQVFVKNLQGEIIEIEGQTMQTMPAQSLLRHLASSKGAEGGKAYEQLGRFIAPVIDSPTREDGS